MNRKMVSAYFDGRRRAYWAQQGGFAPPFSLSAWPARAGRGVEAWPNRAGREQGISAGGFNPAAALLIIPGVIFVWAAMKNAGRGKS